MHFFSADKTLPYTVKHTIMRIYNIINSNIIHYIDHVSSNPFRIAFIENPRVDFWLPVTHSVVELPTFSGSSMHYSDESI